MAAYLSVQDIAVRLGLTVFAGAVLGLNRQEHGRPAGLRTTILVTTAAAIAMMQADLLLPLDGKTASSFAVMDLMRLPLGILSGIGFIGAGAILRRGDIVTGVTTAATLWIATVIGLCFGGGQIGLGLAGVGIGVVVLWPAQWIERRLSVWRQGEVALEAAEAAPSAEAVSELLAPMKCSAHFKSRGCDPSGRPMARYALRWRAPQDADMGGELLRRLESRYAVISIEFD